MFKDGDFLVYKDQNKYKNCLFKIIDDVDAVAIAVEDGKECFVYFADMRLATEDEIAAGHRIDHIGEPNGMDEK
ncbi:MULTISPECIES: hypothetical protein [Acinetobacter]|jgi:hypothetical protein|uniref:Uncharacterized protein n=1 Tax=Acinetobacter junii TaxID=40215 RepID=A0AAW5R564_ACIJU|nr:MULTISPECIES: hypothetical protein [Acinetobacter]KKW78849.1 hypothetical protein AAV96_09540 [Acinetobacter sp. AG1]MCU4395828.1 hypothetical protein [Acinetobacter junii]